MLKFLKKERRKKKILIVEDDKMLSQALSDIIKEEAYKTEVVDNGLDVQKKAEEMEPNLILLDLILPGLDGFAVLKKLKTGTKTKKIPVVILSNLDKPADIKSVKVLGAVDYIIKASTNIEDIIKIIKKYL